MRSTFLFSCNGSYRIRGIYLPSNRRLGLSDERVKVVVAMLRFRRSFVRQSRSLQPLTVSTSFEGGRLKSVTEGFVLRIHNKWDLTINSVTVADLRNTTLTRRRFAHYLADVLIGDRGRHSN